MYARFACFLLALGALSAGHSLSAGLVITEIMYNTNKGEWIEIYNPVGDGAVDLDEYKIEIAGTEFSSVPITLEEGSFAILYDNHFGNLDDDGFKFDWGGVNASTSLYGVLFLAPLYSSSSGALGSTPNAEIEIRDSSGNVIDRVSDFTSNSSTDWPNPLEEQSIYLSDPTADNSVAGNWLKSPPTDLPAGTPENITFDGEVIFASPGYFRSTNTVPEPTSFAVFAMAFALSTLCPRHKRRF